MFPGCFQEELWNVSSLTESPFSVQNLGLCSEGTPMGVGELTSWSGTAEGDSSGFVCASLRS